MTYILPSALVYQIVTSNSGVAAVTPDLPACIVGPCYNVVEYDTSTTAKLAASKAKFVDGYEADLTSVGTAQDVYLPGVLAGQVNEESSVDVYIRDALVSTQATHVSITGNTVTVSTQSTTGSATAGTYVVTVASTTGLRVGEVLKITGAGIGGEDLLGVIQSISGTAITIDRVIRTTVSGVAVTKNSFSSLNPLTGGATIKVGDTVFVKYQVSGAEVTTMVMAVSSSSDAVSSFTTVDTLTSTATAAVVTIQQSVTDLYLPAMFETAENYDASHVTTDGKITINPNPKTPQGTLVSGGVHIAYRALRTDLSASVMSLADDEDRLGQLGVASPDNPLALAAQICLANTTGGIRVFAVPSNDIAGYLEALDTMEGERLYACVPLTQELDIVNTFKTHAVAMSTAEKAAWRIALVNTAIPTSVSVGQYNVYSPNTGSNTVTQVSGSWYLTSSSSTFVSDGVVPGDVVNILSHSPSSPVNASLTVLEVVSNQSLRVSAPTNALSSVSFYVQRATSKIQKAQAVAATSTTFGSSRMIHVMPDYCGVTVNGATQYLPGYYLCAAIAGLIAGLPAQQGLTKVGLSGIADLKNSNFYFTRDQMDTMAEAGTLLVVQATQSGLPYVRHSLTTDMSILQYREIQQVKNYDFLSYVYHDVIDDFCGNYNITPETLQILRTTLIAEGEYLKGLKVAKVGPPLLSYTIKSLAQNTTNKDRVTCELAVTTPTVMNNVEILLLI